ncbi:MAG: cytochrome C oxidase subunit IV family protein [Phycisphaerae bacterium]
MSSDHAKTVMPARTHILSVQTLVVVWVILCALAIGNLFIAKLNLGHASVFIELAVAVIMAVISALYFMHLRYDSLFSVAILLLTLTLITLFISLILIDVAADQPQMYSGEAQEMVQIEQHVAGSNSTPPVAVKPVMPAPAK